MKALISEYGITLVSVILATMFLSGITYMFTSDRNIQFVFRTHTIYSEYNEELGSEIIGSIDSPLDAINGVSNITDKSSSPYFILDSTGIDDVFNISEYLTQYTYTEADNNYTFASYHDLLARVTNNGALHIKKGTGEDVDMDSMEVVIVSYEPEYTYTYGDLTTQKVFNTQSIDATDKYGNRIWDTNSEEFVQTEVIKYDETKWHRHDTNCKNSCGYKDINNFTINMREPNKFKVIYRYQDNAMKCEYIKIFRNEVIPAFEGLKIDQKITD